MSYEHKPFSDFFHFCCLKNIDRQPFWQNHNLQLTQPTTYQDSQQQKLSKNQKNFDFCNSMHHFTKKLLTRCILFAIIDLAERSAL